MAITWSLGRRTVTIQPDQTAIQGLSRAAAMVVTWVAHGLVTGDRVSFYGITTPNNAGEWIALNGNSYQITRLTADTFSVPVNSSAFTAAYVDANDLGVIGSDIDLTRMQSGRLVLNTLVGTFVVGETVTQATSLATGVVYRYDPSVPWLILVKTCGTFDATHTITGGTSGATGIPNEVMYSFPNGMRLSAVDFAPSEAGDTLLIREGNATGPLAFPRRRDVSNAGIHKAVGGRSLRVKPYILAADQEWGVPANVRIVLEFD